jgi:hypothetical protein
VRPRHRFCRGQRADLSSWSWGYHLDALTSKFSSDYDNNGVVAANDSGASLVTSGFMVRSATGAARSPT